MSDSSNEVFYTINEVRRILKDDHGIYLHNNNGSKDSKRSRTHAHQNGLTVANSSGLYSLLPREYCDGERVFSESSLKLFAADCLAEKKPRGHALRRQNAKQNIRQHIDMLKTASNSELQEIFSLLCYGQKRV